MNIPPTVCGTQCKDQSCCHRRVLCKEVSQSCSESEQVEPKPYSPVCWICEHLQGPSTMLPTNVDLSMIVLTNCYSLHLSIVNIEPSLEDKKQLGKSAKSETKKGQGMLFGLGATEATYFHQAETR